MLATTSLLCACGDDETTLKPSNLDLPHSYIGVKDAMPYAGRKEIPAIKDPTMFIVHTTDKAGVNYCVEWDKEQKTQRWSAYTLNVNNNKKVDWSRSNWNGTIWKGRYWTGDPFQEDSIIPAAYRTTLNDYKGSGYDRGHIVNSNDRINSMNANGQTFYLSNIQPQLSGFNGSAKGGGVWLNFENRVNSLGKGLRGDEYLYIVKGGTTQPTMKVQEPFISDSRTSLNVPRYFFMALLKLKTDKTYQAIGLWAEHKFNQDQNIKKYCKSIDELEELTGIDFFHNLDDAIENAVETQCNPSDWGIYQ